MAAIKKGKQKISSDVKKRFCTYVVTTMVTSVLSSIYASIDGIFIGQAVGDNGLTAVNVIWPVEGFATSIARGLGLGGAICMSLALGKGKKEEAYSYRGNTVLLLLLNYLFMLLVFRPCYPEIIRFLGADTPEVYRLAADYTKVYVVGCIFQILACGLQPFLRNANQPIRAMLCQIMGVGLNIILDYFFVLVLHWEVMGAGLATIVAEAAACLPMIYSFFRNKEHPHGISHYRLGWRRVRGIVKSSISPMGASFSNSIMVIFNNRFCLHFGGVVAAAAFSVINYSYCCGFMLVMGIGEGIQPMLSYYYGKKDRKTVKEYLYLGKCSAWLIGGACTLLFILGRKPISVLFGASAEAMSMVMWGMLLSAWLFPFKGLLRLQSVYFNAIGKDGYSNILIYAETIILTPLFLWIFTAVWGVDGVWISLPAIQIFLVFLGSYLMRRSGRG